MSNFDHVERTLDAQRESDSYVGVGLAPAGMKLSPTVRVRADRVAGIPGLWADVDVADPAHKKQNLPPSMEAAREALTELAPEPTILVHSGHGLQAWWLFEEPWVFADGDERVRAQAMARGWHERIAGAWAQHGWALDAAHDLSRVMRLPGTLNHKGDGPVEVTVLQADSPRRSLRDWLAELKPVMPKLADVPISTEGVGAPFTLDPNAAPPALKLVALIENDPKFRRSWNQTRTDLQDSSPSAYDMSLASIALAAGWTDQEVADLLIAWRRQHGHDLKLREDYYLRTMARAREPMDVSAAHRAIEEAQSKATREPEELIRQLCRALRVKLERLTRLSGGDANPVYRLYLTGGETAVLDNVDQILSYSRFRNVIARSIGHVIPHFTPKQWAPIAQALLDSAVDEELPPETTLEGRMQVWLNEYLYTQTIQPARDESPTAKDPFQIDGGVGIYLSDFRSWVYMGKHEEITARAAGVALRNLGYQPHTVATKTAGGKWTTRSAWHIDDG